MGFTKLDEDFFDSSLVAEGPIPTAVFVLLLAKAKADGIARVAATVVGGRLGLTQEQTEAAFALLQTPDPHSRSLEFDGRRIQRVDGGWLILNYRKRREMGLREAVREYDRERKRACRNPDDSGQVPESSASASPSVSVEGGVGEGAFYRRPPGPANPLVAGRRSELESECLALVREVATLTGDDPVDVIAEASGYKGAATTKLNPATMSDDRLANTVRDLRADAAELRKRKGTHDAATQR